jgi:hypothetical protein
MENTMIRQHLKQLVLFALTSTLLLGGTAHAKGSTTITCWTNSDGVRECGNFVPPEYAQKETRTIDKQGMTTEVKERAKTSEELAIERAQQAEEARLAAEEDKRKQAQESYDRVLLATYLNEEDILRSRERQSGSINATIEITRIAVDKLQEKLNDEKKKAAGYERQGKALPERVQQDIDALQEQIDTKNSFIESKELEKQKLHEKYDAEIVRFRELKANGAQLR